MSEQWRPVPGYEGKYEVSNEGRVRSLGRIVQGRWGDHAIKGRVLTPNYGTGYPRVSLSNGRRNDKWHTAVHILVLSAFIGPRPDGMQGCHNDGNPLNNRLGNLRWGTPSENAKDALRHGTQWQIRKTHCPRNHPYDETNTHIRPNGSRLCRTCNRERARKGVAA